MADISGKGIPTTKTVASVGDFYTDSDSGTRYKCDLAYISKDDNGKDVVYYKWSKVRSSSSGGGTTDYTDLTNKPKINGVDLTGNKSTSDLKLVGEDTVNNKVSSIKSYIDSIVGTFDLSWTDDKYISKDDGSVNDEAGSSCSDFIEVIPGTKLIISNTMTTDNERNVFYDSSKTFVSSFSNATGVITVPENAKYFRLSKHTTATLTVTSEIPNPLTHEVTLTKSEYDALTTKDPLTTYYITED